MLRLIIKDYLQSLKERNELDYIFPILLDQMGYQIVKTANSSQGQPEYGKDIVAIGKYNKKKTLYIFQLKAGDAKDINKSTMSGKNGIRESMLQAKEVDFKDSSKSELNKLPRRYVLVHNGEVNQNDRLTFESFITKHFPDNDFERWGIEDLTDYFSKYLLNEYVLTNPEHVNLLKKTLAFIDTPENDFFHFKKLIVSILDGEKSYKKKQFIKMISTLSIISQLVYQYSKEADNLIPARECLTFVLLQTWGWILEKKVEKQKGVIIHYQNLQGIHFIMMENYLAKIIPVALERDGLFSEEGSQFEEIGYPLRSLNFLGYYVYHLYTYKYLSDIGVKVGNAEFKNLLSNFANTLKKVIENNSGCKRPLLDNHSIPILLAIKYFKMLDMDKEIQDYISSILNNISLTKASHNRLPELYNNIDSLIEFVARNDRPMNYTDKSSYLLLILFEQLVQLGDKSEEIFNNSWEFLTKDIHLLTYFPPEDMLEYEHILFQKELYEEGSSQVYNKNKNDDISEFEHIKSKLQNYKKSKIKFRTDKKGLRHLRYLAHLYYKTPLFPSDWRDGK
ncbi:MAG: hypothetical protein GQ534_12565 [Candidatus Delongbacteria bacterium]|nr:hypothetical protein [Candidatus Delongbacteria bacterium]